MLLTSLVYIGFWPLDHLALTVGLATKSTVIASLLASGWVTIHAVPLPKYYDKVRNIKGGFIIIPKLNRLFQDVESIFFIQYTFGDKSADQRFV